MVRLIIKSYIRDRARRAGTLAVAVGILFLVAGLYGYERAMRNKYSPIQMKHCPLGYRLWWRMSSFPCSPKSGNLSWSGSMEKRGPERPGLPLPHLHGAKSRGFERE